MLRLALALASVPVFFARPAVAQEIPRYDVAGHCESVGKLAGGFAHRLENACLRHEQEAYDGLKPRWPALPEETRRYCTEVAALASSGSYKLLEECVELRGEPEEKETFRY